MRAAQSIPLNIAEG
ncbi:MAG: hypothetical protein ACK57G_16305 [Planctomycetota bacterium]